MPFRFTGLRSTFSATRSPVWQAACLLLVWLAIYGVSLARPPLLDDADATHAQAALAMLRTGDWVTLHVNGLRYLEKPPLPYWITAISLRCFGANSFAVHLPLALTVLALALLGWRWGCAAFGERAGFYAALMTLTAAGTFLFTRIFIPDALLSLLLACTLYCVVRAMGPDGSRRWAYAGWMALAGALLTKGLVSLIFVFVPVGLLLWMEGGRAWRQLRPWTGAALCLLVAAPWHVLAGLRNRGGAGGHGFFWFYFINEHVLRFLGRRVPADYNRLPPALYWSLHLVWLFPWSVLALPVLGAAWSRRERWADWRARRGTLQGRSVLMLGLFSAVVLLFFSLSTNQEYYTFPVYLPVLLLVGAGLARLEMSPVAEAVPREHRLLLGAQAVLVVVGLGAGAALGYGLWSSRHLPGGTDVSELFAHRGIGDYTLSMSHFLDMTTASFAALRLPAALACVALVLGPAMSFALRRRKRHVGATLSLALMSTVFLVAAHLALDRFAHMLSSQDFTAEILRLQHGGATEPGTEVLLFGDQALGSSIPFYLGHQVLLVDGRSTSMLFGSTFPDAPPLFLTHDQLRAAWGRGARKLLFVPAEHRAEVEALLGTRALTVYASAGKRLLTDRPLRQTATAAPLPRDE